MTSSEVCIPALDTSSIEPKSNYFVKSLVIPDYEGDILAQGYREFADENVMLAEQALPCIIESWSNIIEE
jgi:hypothetical protein